MLGTDLLMMHVAASAKDWLVEEFADNWQDAMERAQRLALQTEYLTWPDRARVLDQFFWQTANELLTRDQITLVVNRQVFDESQAAAVERYARRVKSMVTALLILLNEQPAVASVWQAVTWLQTRRELELEPALDWLRATEPKIIRRHLARLPGYAFLILATSPNDTAESFIARDAFWEAMLGGTAPGI